MRFRGYQDPTHWGHFCGRLKFAAHCGGYGSWRFSILVDTLFGEEFIKEGMSSVPSATVGVIKDFSESGEVPVCGTSEKGEGFPRAVGADFGGRHMAEAVQDVRVEVLA